MKEHPIIFSTEMIRALLDGRKSMIRLICKSAVDESGELAASVHPDGSGLGWIAWWPKSVSAEETKKCYPGEEGFKCPYGVPGDRFWVRETWAEIPDDGGTIIYSADETDNAWAEEWNVKWRYFMLRKNARLILENTSVRVERVQDISWDDAMAEGWPYAGKPRPFKEGIDSATGDYADYWENLHGEGAWERNDWVYVIGLKRVL